MRIHRRCATVTALIGLVFAGATGGVGPARPAHAAAYPAKTITSANAAPLAAAAGEAVAVVYYRCELKNDKCIPRNGVYYVHNAIALEPLPTASRRAHVGHVAAWPATKKVAEEEDLTICGEAEAATAAKTGDKKLCHGDTVTTWRPWAWVSINAYPGLPIAWQVNAEEPHNGAFICFQVQKTKTDTCDHDSTKVVGGSFAGTLRYQHYVNPGVGRTADDPKKFKLETAEASGIIRIQQLKQLKSK